jgi:hypothetical protein
MSDIGTSLENLLRSLEGSILSKVEYAALEQQRDNMGSAMDLIRITASLMIAVDAVTKALPDGPEKVVASQAILEVKDAIDHAIGRLEKRVKD